MDLRWTSRGGLLLDGTGDLATTLSSMEELQTMVATRFKARPRSWKLYTIGAGFDSVIGSSTGINQNTELAIQRRAQASVSDLLPAGSLNMQTVTWVFSSPAPLAAFRIRSRVCRRHAPNSHPLSNLAYLRPDSHRAQSASLLRTRLQVRNCAEPAHFHGGERARKTEDFQLRMK